MGILIVLTTNCGGFTVKINKLLAELICIGDSF